MRLRIVIRPLLINIQVLKKNFWFEKLIYFSIDPVRRLVREYRSRIAGYFIQFPLHISIADKIRISFPYIIQKTT